MSSIVSPARVERVADRLDRADAHPRRIDRADAAGRAIRARGREAERRGARLGHHQRGGGAVVERAGVAGRHAAAVAEDRLQAARASRRVDAGARRLVGSMQRRRSATGTISRALNPLSRAGARALLGALGEAVHLLARDAEVVGDELGRHPHRHEHAADVSPGAAGSSSGLVGESSMPRPTRETDSTPTTTNVSPSPSAIAWAAAAQRLQRDAHRRVIVCAGTWCGSPASTRDAAADVVALLAPRERAAADHVVDLGRVQLRRAVQQRTQHAGRQVVRADVRRASP